MSGGNNNILSLLGLALRGGRLAVGEEPVALAARSGQARLILLASDAADNTLRRAEHLAQEGRCLRLSLPFSKTELGGALGRGSAAVAALTDTGLAAAVTERLAVQDPERYGEAAARMDLKRRRAKERQSAPRRDPPPRKSPPPGREDRRPPRARREGGPEGRDRPSPHGAGRKPDGRGSGGHWRERPRDGERQAAGKGRSYGGKPRGDRPQAGKPRRPYGSGPSGGRPQEGKGPGRPPRNRRGAGPGPRSAGGGGRSGGR